MSNPNDQNKSRMARFGKAVKKAALADPERDKEQAQRALGFLGGLASKNATGAKLVGAVEQKHAESQDRVASNRAEYGAVVKSGMFGVKTVEIYESGYVRVGVVLTSKSPFERLRSIKFTHQTQERSGAGHLWASGGLGSREKRVLLLTIATQQQIHTLSTEGQAGRGEDKLGLALEAAGNAVLDVVAAPSTVPVAVATPDLADQIKKLSDLRDAGILTDEEFNAKKTELLNRM